MAEGKKYLFASYSQRDSEAVIPVVEALRDEFRARSLNLDVWVPIEEVTPGEAWDEQIARGLRECIGLLAFLSPAAIEESYALEEMSLFTKEVSGRLVFPILLKKGTELPLRLRTYQPLDLSSPAETERAISWIAEAAEKYLTSHSVGSPVSPEAVPVAAAIIADSLRGVRPESSPATKPPDSVFLVHGHDSKRLAEVHTYLAELGVKVVVLAKIAGQSQSLLQKFFQFSRDIRFAVVLLTADDLGASRMQYEADGVGVAALQFRARQNVVFELGFFYGFLGWENVFVVSATPDKVFPGFEPPSDLAGVVYDAIEDPSWEDSLKRKLSKAGFQLATSK